MIMNLTTGKHNYSGTFTIDNTAPTITGGNINFPSAGAVLPGTQNYGIVWTNPVASDANLGTSPLNLYFSVDGGSSWQPFTDNGSIINFANNNASFNWNPSSINSPTGNLVKLKVVATDLAGNSAEYVSSKFNVDGVRPTVTNVTFEKTTIKDAVENDNSNLTQTVSVTFSEEMLATNGEKPTIEFWNGNDQLTATPSEGAWSSSGEDATAVSNSVWTQSFTFADNVDASAVVMKVKSAKDKAGNEQTEYTSTNSFKVDTKNPTVAENGVSATPANAKAGTQVEVPVKFSEAISNAPTVQAVVGANVYIVTPNTNPWSENGTKWTGSFTVPSGAENVYAKITVAGAEDLAGNAMLAAFEKENAFKIDTVAPTVTGISFGTATMYDGDLHQEVTVTFNEKMDKTAVPTLVFDALSGTWSGETGKENGEWGSQTVDEVTIIEDSVWKITRTITDAGEEATGIKATVSGAKDLAGNEIVRTVSTNTFAIDTNKPTVSVSDGVEADHIVKQGETVSFTATFSEAVNEAKISIATTGTDDINAAGMTIASDKKSATYSWNVPSGNDGAVTVSVAAKDIAGNVNTATNGETSYTIDNTSPKMDSITPNNNAFLSGNGNNATLVFDFEDAYLKDLELDIYRPEDTLATRLQATLPADQTIIGQYQNVLANYGVKSASYDNQAQKWTIILDTLSNVWRDGLTRFYIEVEDIAGNKWGNMMAPDNDHMRAWKIDNTAPTIETVTLPVAGAFYKGDQAYVNFTGSDTAGGVSCSYKVGSNDPVSVTCGSATPMTGLRDGRNSVILSVTDDAGNSTSSDPVTFIVDTNNTLTVDDNAPSTAPADFTKIQDAIDAAVSDTTINVASGEYKENIIIPANKIGLKLIGTGTTKPVIKPGANMNSGSNLITVNAVGTEISGFKLDCQKEAETSVTKANHAGDGIHISNADGSAIPVTGVAADKIKIQNNEIVGYIEEGLWIIGGTVDVLNNVITGLGSAQGYSEDSIYTKNGAHVLISGNTLSGNVYTPIENSAKTDYATAAGISIHEGDVVTITGNTIEKNTFGIHVKGAATVSATGNRIIDNAKGDAPGTYKFGFFHVTSVAPSTKFTASSNWWGSGKKSEIESLVSTNSVDFAPWHLEADGNPDSSSDTAGPSVTLAKSITSSFVKKNDAVTIFATLNDGENGSGVDESIAPTITITNGQAAGVNLAGSMTKEINESTWTGRWKFDWTVPNITGVIQSYVTVKGYDIVGNEGTSDNVDGTTVTPTMSFVNDNNAPFFNLSATGQNYGVDAGPVKNDFISIYDVNAGNNYYNTVLASAGYGFSDKVVDNNPVCDDTITYTSEGVTVSGNTITFTVGGDHTNYLCVKATDQAGNIGYQVIGNDTSVTKLNVDNTAPAAPEVTFTSLINSANQAAVEVTVKGEANTTINWSIKDSTNKTVSGTILPADNDGDITISPIDVTSLGDGTLNLSVTLTDGVNLTSSAGSATATKEATAPFVEKVTSTTGDGSYNKGDTINVAVEFSEIVNVTGTPQITLETGGTDRTVSYSSGSGTDTLTFAYAVQNGDGTNDLDYTSVSALILNGGTIKDAAGNAANLTLPDPGAAGSLGANKNIVIDTTAPTSGVTVPAEWNKADVELTFTCNDGTIGSGCSKVYYTTDGSAPTAASSFVDAGASWKHTFSAEGEFTVKFMATDAAGNTEAAQTATNTLKIDKTAPVTTASAPVGTQTGDTTVTLSASDANSSLAVSGVKETRYCVGTADNCTPDTVGTSVSVTNEGTNYVRYYSSDNAGNNETVKSVQVKIDKSAPVISGQAPTAAVSTLDPVIKANFMDASNVDVSSVQVLVTGGTIEFDNSYFSVTPAGITSSTNGIMLAKNTTYKVTITGLKDELGNVTADFSWSFTVKNDATAIDTTAPTAVSNPANGATGVKADADIILTFSEPMDKTTLTASNIALKKYEGSALVTAVLEVSEDGTQVTIDPESNLTPGAKYYITIASNAVKDLAGNYAASWTKNDNVHAFTVASPTTQASINLKQGWNLISLPLIPTNSAIADVISDISSKVNIVQHYDPTASTNGGWLSYSPSNGGLGNLTKMEDGKGYWIDMKEAATLTITGRELPAGGANMLPTYAIQGEKWNLIGFKSTEKMQAKDYITQMGSTDILYAYKDGEYVSLRETDKMEPGYGYWFYTYDKDGFDIIPTK